ncbi:MAG: hypothetical protein AAFN18_17115 [Cyanobacteria bacterium J06554_6]
MQKKLKKLSLEGLIKVNIRETNVDYWHFTMTGFIRGLFGKGNNPEQPKEAFFLSEDDAKSFGDIEYMRSSKTVKRTFAKKKGQTEEIESVRSISAMGAKEIKEGDVPQPKKASSAASFSTPTPSFSTPAQSKPAAAPQPKAEDTAKRTPDSSMDMFRNMARDMRR